MPHIFVQCRFPHKNLVPADAVINTFHFVGIDDPGDMVTAILARLTQFWNAGAPTNPLKNYYSGEINFPGGRAKFYDWDDPEPRAPIADESLSISASEPISPSNLPGEVALCTSYRGPLISGGIPARRRGRLYIGPLNAATLDTGSANPARPIAAFRTVLAETTERLAAASTLGARWVVWSRVGNSATPIEFGWVDNAFDTQRRRGVAASTRANWEVEIP